MFDFLILAGVIYLVISKLFGIGYICKYQQTYQNDGKIGVYCTNQLFDLTGVTDGSLRITCKLRCELCDYRVSPIIEKIENLFE